MVIEHKTYPAAGCVHCHTVALRICIVHDRCEFPDDYHAARCATILKRVNEARALIARFEKGAP